MAGWTNASLSCRFSWRPAAKSSIASLEVEMEKFRRLKNVTIEVTEEARCILARQAYERSSEEGARVPRAINEVIVTKAIDVLDIFEDESQELEPQHLIASAVGLSSVKVEKVR